SWRLEVHRIGLGEGFEKLNKQHQMIQKGFNAVKEMFQKSFMLRLDLLMAYSRKSFDLPSLDYCGQLESFIEKLYKKQG
ncbi:1851_t:CDS:2, partial [Gigaspora rosea]